MENIRAGMDPDMVRRIDKVLSRVQDPESLVSVADLNLVSKVTFSKTFNKLVIETDINSPRIPCALCGIITGAVRDSIHRDLEEEFRREFPGCNVVAYQAGVEDGTPGSLFS